MKDVSLQLIGQWPADEAAAHSFLKHKAVQVVALIAKREWPHHWPTLFTQLTQLSLHSDAHCEIVLLVLGEMGEGLFSDDKMADGRRNELLVALNAEFPALFTFCYKVLEDKFVRYQQAADASARQRYCRLVSAALKTFEAYAPLCSLTVLCQCGLLNAVQALLGAEEVRDNALQVLLAICAKKSRDAPPDVFGPFALSLLSMCQAGLLTETDYSVHKQLCQALKDLGCNHLHALMPPVPAGGGYIRAIYTRAIYIYALYIYALCVSPECADAAVAGRPRSDHGPMRLDVTKPSYYLNLCATSALLTKPLCGRPVPAAALPPVVVELLKLMAAFSNYEVWRRMLTHADAC